MFRLFLVGLLVAMCEARNYLFKEGGLHHLRDDYIMQTKEFDKTVTHTVVFSVKQNGMDELTDLLFDVSDPKSVNYGQYLNRDEVAEITSNPVAERAILNYLAGVHGVHPESISRSPYGEYVTAEAPVHVWEKEFDTSFHTFVHEKSGSAVVRAQTYSLHENIHAHVNTVWNTVQLPARRQERSLYSAYSSTQGIDNTHRAAAADDATTLSLLKSFYNVPSDDTGSSSVSQSCFETDQEFSPLDLQVFQTANGLSSSPVVRVYGGHDDNAVCYNDNTANALTACGGANLNVQYMMGMAPDTPTTFWYQYSYVKDVFAGWIHDVASLAAPPLVHSVTLGYDEVEVDTGVINEFNSLAIKLGTMGVTILVQSGENGANSQFGRCGFWPQFPASSPYVTTIGATQGVESGSAEVACQSNKGGVATSGGGFSVRYPQPSYQNDAVAAWRAICNNQTACGPVESGTGVGQYVAYGGRAYPDLALAGHNYEIVVGGITYLVSGTAASTPAVAGMVSLVNAARVANGLSTVGFMNPTLYAATNFINDITEGMNQCLDDQYGGSCCASGFNATVGWDPVTGLGSVDYAKFKDIFPTSRRRTRALRASRSQGRVGAVDASQAWGVRVMGVLSVAAERIGYIRNYVVDILFNAI